MVTSVLVLSPPSAFFFFADSEKPTDTGMLVCTSLLLLEVWKIFSAISHFPNAGISLDMNSGPVSLAFVVLRLHWCDFLFIFVFPSGYVCGHAYLVTGKISENLVKAILACILWDDRLGLLDLPSTEQFGL